MKCEINITCGKTIQGMRRKHRKGKNETLPFAKKALFFSHDAFMLSSYMSVLLIWHTHASWHSYRSNL